MSELALKAEQDKHLEVGDGLQQDSKGKNDEPIDEEEQKVLFL